MPNSFTYLTVLDASETPCMGGTHPGFRSLILEIFSYSSNKNLCKGERVLGKTALCLMFYQPSH